MVKTKAKVKATSKQKWTLKRALPYILIVTGIVAYLASAVLMYDTLKVANDPNYIPSCDLNPIVSCGVVLASKQATTFGVPNDVIGLGAFPLLSVIGVAILAGATFKRWFWLCMEAGVVFGLGFVHYLFFQSVYRIGDLCPFCISMWVATITAFWYVTLYNIDEGHIKLPAGRAQLIYAWIRKHHLDILVLWFLVIAALILKHFWYYYGKYF